MKKMLDKYDGCSNSAKLENDSLRKNLLAVLFLKAVFI